MPIYIPSEEELEATSTEFSLLPEDDYIVEVVKRTIKDKEYPRVESQPDLYRKTDEYPEGTPRDVLNVCLQVISFSNGDPLYDVNGDEVKDERFFLAFLDTTKVGLKPQPSRFRKFIAAAFGQPVNSPITFQSWDELIGKRLIASMRHSKNGRQQVYDYKMLRRRPQRQATTQAETTANNEQLSEADLAARAEEVFGPNAPTF